MPLLGGLKRGFSWRNASYTCMIGLLILSFQNCSPTSFDTGLTTNQATSTDTLYESNAAKYGTQVAQKIATMPFAYDLQFDQIAYNSCFHSEYIASSNPFSFKFGAYQTGGISHTPSFLSYIADKANFKPLAGLSELSLNQKKSYLYDSSANRNRVLQMAWRTKGRPNDLRTSNPTQGKDYFDISDLLSNDPYLHPLFQAEGERVRHFPLITEETKRHIEAGIFYNDSESSAEFFRDDLYFGKGTDGSQGMLTFLFRKGDGDAESPLISTEGLSSDSAKGLGYTFEFIKQSGAPTNHPKNILSQVEEYDLSNNAQTESTWTCPQELVFMIVRKEDASTRCPSEPLSSFASNASYRSKLALVRNQLSPSLWDVNIASKCVVPKSFECYPKELKNGVLVPVEYTAASNKECYQSHKPSSHYTTNPPGSVVNYCPQFISICIKQ